MKEILHQFIGSSSHYLQGFVHPTSGWEWDFWTINSRFGVDVRPQHSAESHESQGISTSPPKTWLHDLSFFAFFLEIGIGAINAHNIYNLCVLYVYIYTNLLSYICCNWFDSLLQSSAHFVQQKNESENLQHFCCFPKLRSNARRNKFHLFLQFTCGKMGSNRPRWRSHVEVVSKGVDMMNNHSLHLANSTPEI